MIAVLAFVLECAATAALVGVTLALLSAGALLDRLSQLISERRKGRAR